MKRWEHPIENPVLFTIEDHDSVNFVLSQASKFVDTVEASPEVTVTLPENALVIVNLFLTVHASLGIRERVEENVETVHAILHDLGVSGLPDKSPLIRQLNYFASVTCLYQNRRSRNS